MPIYEYECPECGIFETMQGIKEPPLTVCATCQRPVRRVISASAFSLKGGGWYKDLYSSTSSKPAGTESTSSSPPNPEKAA